MEQSAKICYYLVIPKEYAELELQDPLFQRMLACVDEERKKKILGCKSAKNRMLRLGVSLLLQKGLRDFENEELNPADELQALDLEKLTVDLEHEKPLQPKYNYGKSGKPYFSEVPLLFSLSHSGAVCLCALSTSKIGADVQLHTKGELDKLAKRVLDDRELGILETLETDKEKEYYFFERWAVKESIGKCTGEGIFSLLDREKKEEFANSRDKFITKTYEITVGETCYSIAVSHL